VSGVDQAARAGRAVVGWWLSPVPLARVAVLRAAIYLFVIWDMLYVTNDVIGHGYAPALYQPTLFARVLPFPEPSVPVAWTLLVVTIVGCLVAAAGRLPRLAGGTVAVTFTAWMMNSQGFSYVSHDHMALMVAVLVLPTVGRARFTDTESSQAAGWAVRAVAVATVITYFGSAFNKWVRAGSPWAWANGSVFTWAILRRGAQWVRWSLDYPVLLVIGQWTLLVAEFLSPVVLWLRGRWLLAAVSFFMLFHLVTFLALGIHFLPTVVCWLAFFPLERVVPWVRGVGERLPVLRSRLRGSVATEQATASS
jgi:hypothetical protein